MIDIKTLREIGKLKGISNLSYMEKDYLQEVILLIIYRNFDFLVFKGGTCLYKFYKLDRFSEVLDFSARAEFEINHLLETIKNGLGKFNFAVEEVTYKKAYHSYLAKFRIRALLYSGSPSGLCTIRVDINLKSEVKMVQTLNLRSLYPDLPSFDVSLMATEEILAEKIRAIMTRTKARDVYDLWFLLKGGTQADLSLIKEKLKYYEKEYDFEEFKKHLHLKKEVWGLELTSLLPVVPPFREVKKLILEKMPVKG